MKSIQGASYFLLSTAILISACGPDNSSKEVGKQIVGEGLSPRITEASVYTPTRRVLNESLPYNLLVQFYILPNGSLESCYITKSPIAAFIGDFETERTQSIGGFDFCVQEGVPSKGWAWNANSEGAPQTNGEVNIDSSQGRVAVYFQGPFMVEVFQVGADGSNTPIIIDGLTGLQKDMIDVEVSVPRWPQL